MRHTISTFSASTISVQRSILMDSAIVCSREFNNNDFPTDFDSFQSASIVSRQTAGPGASTGSKALINILLMGQTGVGKTTMINALRNYMEYPTLQEAMAGGLKVLIPCKFMQAGITVQVGEADSQEACTNLNYVGQSSTQSCRSHFFTLPDERQFRIIDTPGIGDVRGLRQDKENTEHILRYLKKVDHLHGICILLKPNESRLTPEFMFCLTALLTNLHKHAANNIMFCYTNTRSTLYSHGDTDGLVTEMLSRIKKQHGQDISYNDKNTFFFDSESFRLLACVQQGMKFSRKIVDAFSGSWDNSVQESDRLLSTVLKVKPHIVAETVSLNDARQLITMLSRPLAEIANTVSSNITKISFQRKKIEETKNEKEQLEACLWREVEVLEVIPIGHPRTVCTAKSCIKIVGSVTEYSTICHDPCYLDDVPHDTIGHPALRHCACVDEAGKCTVGSCRCSWLLHQHITYRTRRVQEKKKDESVKKQIREKRSIKEIVESTVKQIQKDIAELESEKKVISNACASYAVFLKDNAITPFNDSIDQYLENMIQQRRDMNEMAQVKELEKLRKEYQEEKQLYEKNLAQNSSQSASSFGFSTLRPLKPKDIHIVLARLEKLPKSGPSLTQQIAASKLCGAKASSYPKSSTNSRPKMTTANRTWFGQVWSSAVNTKSKRLT